MNQTRQISSPPLVVDAGSGGDVMTGASPGRHRDHVHPRRAWVDDPAHHRDQLVHAADPGRYVAACGVIVEVVADPWSDPHVSTPLAGCPVCADVVRASWRDTASRPS